jgi:hypothetical protein
MGFIRSVQLLWRKKDDKISRKTLDSPSDKINKYCIAFPLRRRFSGTMFFS